MSGEFNPVPVPMYGGLLRLDVLVFARLYTTLREVEDRRRRALPIEAESVLARFSDDPGSVPRAKAVLAASHPAVQALWSSLFDMQHAIVRNLPGEVEAILDRLNAIRAAHRSGRTVRYPILSALQ